MKIEYTWLIHKYGSNKYVLKNTTQAGLRAFLNYLSFIGVRWRKHVPNTVWAKEFLEDYSYTEEERIPSYIIPNELIPIIDEYNKLYD